MVKQVIILGGHIQALGLARQTAGMGIPVVLFVESGCCVSRYSRAVRRTVVFKSMEELGKRLEAYKGSGTLLFPTADEYVEYLSEHAEDLRRLFYVAVPSREAVELFADKRRTYQYAAANGIPHPRSMYPESLADVERMAADAVYPLVVKPSVMYSFHKLFGKKAFRCDSSEALIQRCRDIESRYPLSGILIQEFLSGGAPSLYSFGVYAVDGEPKAWITANRIRQNPMDFGNSTTFAVSCDVPEIEQSARRILRDTRYTGLAEVEYMYDAPSGEYKFLEINTRAWKWHGISAGQGFGFLSEMIHYLNGEPGAFRPDGPRTAWVERLTDYTIILKETLKGRMKLSEALRSYRQRKVSAVWSWKDPLPALMYLLLSPILYVKRH